MDTIARVRRAFHTQGWSMKKIARELHVSRIEAFAHIAACEPSEILVLATEVAEALMQAYPAFARGLLSLESRRLVMLLVALETCSAPSMEQRLANRLLLLASTFGRPRADGSGTLIELRLPQHVLAELIGTTRQRVNQILLAWDREGILRHKDARVLLRDPGALSRMIAE